MGIGHSLVVNEARLATRKSTLCMTAWAPHTGIRARGMMRNRKSTTAKIHEIIIESEIGEPNVRAAHHAVSYWFYAIVVLATWPTQWMWQLFYFCSFNSWPRPDVNTAQSFRYGQLLCFRCCSTENMFEKFNCHDFFSSLQWRIEFIIYIVFSVCVESVPRMVSAHNEGDATSRTVWTKRT